MFSANAATIESLADTIMRAVVNSGAVSESNIVSACEIIRAEIKAFIFGEEYAPERAGIMAGTISQQTATASIAASCILKIEGVI